MHKKNEKMTKEEVYMTEREELPADRGGGRRTFMTFRQTGEQQREINSTKVKMAPQLYITMYKEQFVSPGRVKRAELRPTSAHRRNNPQPQPDFLFPRSLQTNYRSTHTLPSPPVDTNRQLFPPVRHLSSASPVRTCPDSSLNTVDTGNPQHMPPFIPSTVQALPSVHGLQKPQLTEPPAAPGTHLHTPMKNPSRMDYQRNVLPFAAQQLRQQAASHPCTRPRTSNATAAQQHLPPTQNRKRSRSSSILDYSGCYSCFHVVKPFQAGHYIIHPEFVSECLH